MEGENHTEYPVGQSNHTDQDNRDSDDDFYKYMHTSSIGQDLVDAVTLYGHAYVLGTIATFGMVTNIINIIVFHRQGVLIDSCNVTLTGLAVADFFCCFFSAFISSCNIVNVYLDESKLPYNHFHIYKMLGFRPQTMCNQIVCFTTAYLAFERSLTVLIPFKVKFLFTPKRSFGVVVVIYFVNVLFNINNLASGTFVWEVLPNTNFTQLTYRQFNNTFGRSMVFTRYVFFYSYLIILRIMCIFVVIICNCIIIWRVKLSTKFRKLANISKPVTSKPLGALPVQLSKCEEQEPKTDKSTPKMQKERKLLLMITIICSIFLICNTPDVMSVIYVYILHPVVTLHLHRIEGIITVINMAMQTLSSSCNIIVYYTMSTRYKEQFRSLFCMKVKS